MIRRPRRIAFYAPMKSPDHPVPSGDRTVARLYVQALQAAGFAVDVISDFRAYDGAGLPERQRALVVEASAERQRIESGWAKTPENRPDLWFTYHCYHKAPDLLGPQLSSALSIPYVIAEPSVAPKRATGRWAAFYTLAAEAIAGADVVFLATRRDAECVEPLRAGKPALYLPPFMDIADWPSAPETTRHDQLDLVTVAMMRPGDKLASYELLARALELAESVPLHLTIIGDGPAGAEVQRLFAGLGDRVTFAGEVRSREVLAHALVQNDAFIWPAVNEAYGMALLEAQAVGLPVIAGDEGGVSDVVRDGETGVLTAPGDAGALAQAIELMFQDHVRRHAMGEAASRFVRSERTVEAAAKVLAPVLTELLAQ